MMILMMMMAIGIGSSFGSCSILCLFPAVAVAVPLGSRLGLGNSSLSCNLKTEDWQMAMADGKDTITDRVCNKQAISNKRHAGLQ